MRGCVGVFAAASVMAATPERIELENYRRSSKPELQEVSEEVLTRFNLNLDDQVHIRCRREPESYEGSMRSKLKIKAKNKLMKRI